MKQWHGFQYADGWEKQLLIQIAGRVLDTPEVETQSTDPGNIFFLVTDEQAEHIVTLFSRFQPLWNAAVKIILLAFIAKHSLASSKQGSANSLTADERQFYRAAQVMVALIDSDPDDL